MQGDYTKKAVAVAERDRAITTRETSIETFVNSIKTGDGLADYMAKLMEGRSGIVGAAFERVATGSKAKDFLIAIGESNPEVMEEAYEQLQEIMGDDDARKRYHRERDLSAREADVQERDEQARQSLFNKEFGALEDAALKEARRLGIEDDDLPVVIERLKARVKGNYRNDGSITLQTRDAKSVARDTHDEQQRLYEKALKKVNRKTANESRKATKRKAIQGGKKRVAPKGAKRKEPVTKGKFKAPEGKDPLDAFVDHRLSS